MSKLYVVGIGPGAHDEMTIRADKVLSECDIIVGYHVYVDLVKDYYPDREFLTTPMTKEADRCRIAIETARSGKTTAMICSGDSGIYGMAALIYELRGESDDPEIVVIPGITAAASGGALLGAPLTHDFAVISLSDRLTPWEKIEKRLKNAAEADLSIVLYNPQSKGRPDHLKKACDILLSVLPGERICGIAKNIGRTDEAYEILSLEKLRDTDVDMFSTVFIGNEMTRTITDRMITPRGYHYE